MRCWCPFGRKGAPRRRAPRVDAISAVGAGDVLLAGFIAGRLEGGTAEEALRKAIATATASTLEVGAGVFEPREVGRLLPSVVVEALEPVPSEL